MHLQLYGFIRLILCLQAAEGDVLRLEVGLAHKDKAVGIDAPLGVEQRQIPFGFRSAKVRKIYLTIYPLPSFLTKFIGYYRFIIPQPRFGAVTRSRFPLIFPTSL